MTKSKKILSVILCLVMLLSTVAVGMVVNAEGTSVKSYAELVDEYGDDFIYVATTFTRADGSIIDKSSATVNENETITCNVYLKSDMKIFTGTIIGLVYDKNFFAERVNGVVPREGSGAKAKAEIFEYGFDEMVVDSSGELLEYLDGKVSLDEVVNEWSFAEVELTGPKTGTNGYANYQVPADFTLDEPICSFNLTAKVNFNGYNSGYVKAFAPLYTCNPDAEGDEPFTVSPKKRNNTGYIPEHFDYEDADWVFGADTTKKVTFKDADGAVISVAQVERNGKLTLSQIPDTSSLDFYSWKDRSGKEFTTAEIMAVTVDKDLEYTIVKASVPVKFMDGENEIATVTGKKGTSLKAAQLPDAEENDVYKWVDVATGTEYTPEELVRLTITGEKTFNVMKASVDILFKNGEDEVAAVVGKKGQKLAADKVPDTSDIENFFKWKDESGKLYTAEDISKVTVTGETVYTAVLSDKEVTVTINLNGGELEVLPEGATVDEATGLITVVVPITGLDLAAFVPVRADGLAFGGWYDENNNEFSGQFISDSAEVELRAAFGEQVVIKVLPLEYETESVVADPEAEVPEGKEPVMVNVNKWVDLGYYTYTGNAGDPLNVAALIDIQKYVNANKDKLDEIVITDRFRDENGNPTVSVGYGNYNDTLSETSINTSAFCVNAENQQLQGKAINTAGSELYCFGEAEGKTSLKALYLVTSIKYDVEVYRPTFDSEGYVVKNEDEKYGFEWAEPYKVSSVFSSIRLDGGVNKPYTNVNNQALADSDPALGSNRLSLLYIQRTDIEFNYDETKYKPTFLDENGSQVRTSDVRVLCYDYNITEGERGVIRVYVTLEDRVYHVGFMVDGLVYAAKGEYKYNDVISLDSIREVYESRYVVANSYETATTIKTTSLYSSGTTVNKQGFELINIYYRNAAGEQVNINDGGTAVITLDFIGAYKRSPNADDKDDYYLCFETEWASKDYTFEIYYQNANEEWELLETKVFSGSSSITYAEAIGLGSELDKMIKEDHPSFLNPNESFTTEPGGTPAIIKAYEAENDTNTMKIYVVYSNTTRYVFIDYNNGYDQDGNLNVDKIGEGTRYTRNSYPYMTVLYDANYSIETAGENDVMPALYVTMNNFSVPTIPSQSQKKDADGNKLYEPVMEQATDEEGNLVYNYDGTPKMVNKLDEEGNVVYDKDKPIMDDLKGNSVYRPYRNCEYLGFKVYYVDGVYSSFEDLPDKAEWKEGYNDRNETGAQHLYSTVILQAQWIADSAFRYRVYDDCNKLSFAKGKDGKKYYWNVNGIPCKKGENVLVETDSEGNASKFLILFRIVKEEGNGRYLKAISMSKDFLNITTTSGYIPVILELVKGLLK